MATSFKYKFGKSLGALLILTYVLAAIIGVTGTAYGLDNLLGFKAWYFWLGAVIAGLLVLWFVPRPMDVTLLAPLAIYGGKQELGLTWTMSVILVSIPVILVILMSLGRK